MIFWDEPWQGAEMKALSADERWHRWNAFRSGAQIPGGETMLAIQARFVGEMMRLRSAFEGDHIAFASHGDPIRAALCHWLGMPLDFLHRLQIDPAPMSVVHLDRNTVMVECINSR